MNAAARESAWTIAAALLVAGACVGRIHNAWAFPPLLDFDGPAHALYVFELHEGRLPAWRTWAGFHPPLYYALGAALWHALPDAIPVHAGLRLLSLAAGIGTVAIVWRTLTRFTTRADAAAVAACVATAPVFALASSMLGNEMLCAFFATAALARVLDAPHEPRDATRHALATGLLAAAAALSKSTGLGVVAVVAATYALRLRSQGAAASARAIAAAALPAALLLVPLYAPRVLESGSLLSIIRGGAPADALGSEMAAQPPGVRHVADYFLVPIATFVAPFKDAPGMVRSVPGLLYASTWADGHGQFLPVRVASVVGAAAVGALLGLFPTALAIAGLVRVARRRVPAGTEPVLAYGALLFAVFLVQTWVVPVYSAVKASYLLSATLAGALALAAGLGAMQGRGRAVARAALLAIGAHSTFLTWYGWWS